MPMATKMPTGETNVPAAMNTSPMKNRTHMTRLFMGAAYLRSLCFEAGATSVPATPGKLVRDFLDRDSFALEPTPDLSLAQQDRTQQAGVYTRVPEIAEGLTFKVNGYRRSGVSRVDRVEGPTRRRRSRRRRAARRRRDTGVWFGLGHARNIRLRDLPATASRQKR